MIIQPSCLNQYYKFNIINQHYPANVVKQPSNKPFMPIFVLTDKIGCLIRWYLLSFYRLVFAS